MTHLPTSERYWNSETLNRRIKLSEVPALSDADLAMFRLELQDASSSVREQIERLGDTANPEWKKRATGKQRQTYLFVVACGNEAHRRDRAAQLEKARLKTQRVAENNKHNKARATQYIRALNALVTDEIGRQRAKALFKRASQIAAAAVEQAP
jgi:hypothetical protein